MSEEWLRAYSHVSSSALCVAGETEERMDSCHPATKGVLQFWAHLRVCKSKVVLRIYMAANMVKIAVWVTGLAGTSKQ